MTDAALSGLPDDLLARARAMQPRTVRLRRALHRHPETGLDLPRTQERVLSALADLPVTVHRGRTCSSVVGILDGARPGPTLLLRGDMDALPLTEDTGLPFSSEVDGAMHACGHDTHVAMLASAARLVAEDREHLAGRVLLMFQPGEEGFHGAQEMLDDGLLETEAGTPDVAYALHTSSTLPAGELHHRPGPIMAAADVFQVRVTGRGGHASAPHNALDPVPAAAAMVGALQTAVTRRVAPHDPAVITVARIAAGTTSNVIPETAELEGTLRIHDEHVRTLLRTEIARVCEHTAQAYGCTAEVTIVPGYPVTVNDGGAAADLARIGGRVLGPARCVDMPHPSMGAEDFSYVLGRVPGAFAFVGACPPAVDPDTAPPNHSNRVVFDESAMAAGVAVHAGIARAVLAR